MSSIPTAAGDAVNRTRRRLLRYLAGIAGISTIAIVVTPVIGFLVPSKESTGATGGKVAVASTDSIPPGQGKVVAVGSKPAIVVNVGGTFKAYSAICTHLGCIVAFDATANAIVCPCHDGRFSPASGAVISGPPPAPLPGLTVSVEKDKIFVVPA
jgi:cytochrome b6-f complex iron-sulfur subunit